MKCCEKPKKFSKIYFHLHTRPVDFGCARARAYSSCVLKNNAYYDSIR